ncbi:MAG: PIN domain-containing protein [Gaiellaceae bacterium MAG52_C11]|nr:PIN domain-containing protein [Candidatus Gaiellasilicea maunaloa]
MLLDANLLLYAANQSSPFHMRTREWLDETLNGSEATGIPWQSLGTFLRISTNRRAFPNPLAPTAAWAQISAWLASPSAWTPVPGPRYANLLGSLIERHQLAGDVVMDGQLAALALEHGLAVASADTDFARFTEIEWVNPVAP